MGDPEVGDEVAVYRHELCEFDPRPGPAVAKYLPEREVLGVDRDHRQDAHRAAPVASAGPGNDRSFGRIEVVGCMGPGLRGHARLRGIDAPRHTVGIAREAHDRSPRYRRRYADLTSGSLQERASATDHHSWSA
ncbi:hypothetical protein BRC86_05875 [Halobacteriales archaeon QS_3_64_16]|nr:MAG: hypothetical protein BRC86_05875 [Halobacteriales archaeon QS_3_64_16]